MARTRRRVRAAAVLILACAACGGGRPATAPQVRLDAGPAVAALVDPVHISVSGLPPSGLVTMQARALDQHGQPWESAAVFRAGTAGTLNLATAVPISGSTTRPTPPGCYGRCTRRRAPQPPDSAPRQRASPSGWRY